MVAFCLCMDGTLSESEKQRMAEFAATPTYERDPEMLLPDADD